MSELGSIREIEQALAELRDAATDPGQAPTLRTSAMTHLAWVPERWVEAATGTLAGLAERHPSRTILLFPRPDDPRDVLEAGVDQRCFLHRGERREVCSEVIEIKLCGRRAAAPASVVSPLLLPDLPVFLRWRGPIGTEECERELIAVVDRLVVDSAEWPDLGEAYDELAGLFDSVTVSDIAWARTRRWREAVAALWPDIAEASSVRVAGPEADATLIARWLGARLDRTVELEHEPAGEIELVEVDGRAAKPTRAEPSSPSDLLSDQLDVFGRDRVYEEAVRASSAVAA